MRRITLKLTEEQARVVLLAIEAMSGVRRWNPHEQRFEEVPFPPQTDEEWKMYQKRREMLEQVEGDLQMLLEPPPVGDVEELVA